MSASGDDGYFPRGRSILRRVHGERAVGLLYGQRALMIGALHPLAFAGTIEHTGARERPFQRLAHTAEAFETIFFGSRAEADEVLARVRRLHERVEGELPRAAGATPAGSRYSAFDPDLMLWTLAVIADSAATFYELLVRRLGAAEREALWREYLLFGELFGLPREAAPAGWGEFRRYWEAMLASERMHLSDGARYTGYVTAFEIPVPRAYGPFFELHDLLMLGSLPPRVRELYGLPWSASRAAAFRAACGGVRRSRPLLPRVVRRGRNSESFHLVARTERRRLRRGEPTPRIPQY